MRLKTMPRQRRSNCCYARLNETQRHKHISTSTLDGQNKEILNTEECSLTSEGQKDVGMKIGMSPKVQVTESSVRNDTVPIEERKFLQETHGAFGSGNFIEDTFGAVNLSIRDNFEIDEVKQTANALPVSNCKSVSEKFVGSALYQIMTDPKFVENIQNSREVKKLTCKFCAEKFHNEEELLDHTETRVNEHNQITCCACSKTFAQKRYLRYHRRCHVNKNKFNCGICPKKYSRVDNLTRHRVIHTNPNRHQCQICKKAFSRKDLMTRHAKCHEEKMIRVACDQCGEVFVNSNVMRT